MAESVFQTLMLLAYFDIALISIAIANFAVSASYLGRESRLSRWRMEKRKKQLDGKIKELQTKGLSIEELKKETKEAEDDMKVLGRRIILLSWLGAVVLPSMFFFVSFVFSVFGMNIEILSQDLEIQRFLAQQFIIFSSGTLALGFMVLLLVLRVIDSAARRVPVPEFEVYFANQARELKYKRKETVVFTLCINNKGEDVAEDVLIMINIPPAFKLHIADYITCKQGPETDYPDYDAAIFKADCIHINTILNENIMITTPDEKKIYKIYVSIYERKIGVSYHKLTIEVVD